MARAGVYKSDVEKARNSLFAQGINPSIDAVRAALGNTGSRTTIHRYLKELEGESPEKTRGERLTGALADLVERLSKQLGQEADAKIAEVSARYEAQLKERDNQLTRQKAEASGLREQLERTEVAIHAEQEAHAGARRELAEAKTALRQLEERIDGLNTRVAEHEAHTQSLEDKHRQAREALEHFRTTAKEQREQEHRRHEHQVQGLQVELRQSQEALTGKNHELLQLNRENARLTESQGQQNKDMQQLRSDLRARDHQIDEFTLVATEHQLLKARWTEAVQTSERLRSEVDELTKLLAEEREARECAQALAARTGEQFSTIEKLLKELGDRSAAKTTADSPAAAKRSGKETQPDLL